MPRVRFQVGEGIDYVKIYVYDAASKTGHGDIYENGESFDEEHAAGSYVRFNEIAVLDGYEKPVYHRTDNYEQDLLSDAVINYTAQTSFKNGTVRASKKSSPTPNYYTVYFNATGGTGAPNNQVVTSGVQFTLSSTRPSRSDSSPGSFTVTLNPNGGSVTPSSLTAKRTTSYSFSHWNTREDGGGSDYYGGYNYTIYSNLQLYAIWFESTTTAAVTLPTPTRTGYDFQGWSTDSGATSGITGSYTPTGNVTLYAIWKIKSYTVSYNANGGSGAPSAQTKYYGVDLTLSSVTPTHASTTPSPASYTVTLNSNGGSAVSSPLTANRRTEYTFANWNTKAGGGGTAYSPGGTYSANESATLCAIWSWATITDEVTLPTPTRSLYTFMGWAEDASASSGVKGSYRPTKNVTLYAIWKQNKYTVEYRSNGGSFSDGTTSKSIDPVVPNEHIDLANYSVSRSGYVFAGWCLNSDPIGHTVYPPGYEYEVIGNTVFYAAWKITLTYMAKGQLYTTELHFPGERFTMSQSVSGGTYYSFGGWRYAGQAIQPGTTTSFSSSATLTAILTMQLYYWFGSDAADSSYFARGQPVTSALSASAWNRMIMHTYELRELLGQSAITISGVSSGDPVTADAFNRLRSLISRTTGAGTLPGAVSQGTEITTGLFNGAGSLKGALNTAIEAYNRTQ